MKRLFLANSLLLGLTLIFAGAAEAQFYAELNAGGSLASESDVTDGLDSAMVEFDPGFAVGGAIGYRFLEQVRGEINLSYRKSDVDKLKALGYVVDGAGDVSSLAVMANGYYDIDTHSPITPYVGVGIGFANIDASCDAEAFICLVDDDASVFAWNVMLGASFALSELLDLSLGYRYFGATDAELDSFGTKVKATVGANEILLGLRFNF